MQSHVGVLDSEIFGQWFGTDEMRGVFSDRNTIQQWLNAEAALAEAQAEAGLIPAEAAGAIAARADTGLIPLDILREKYAIVGYPILPLLKTWEPHLGEDAARWVHWGATTQDITDTGFVLQLKQALAILERQIDELTGDLRTLARRHRDTAMAGRTHGQHAVPITFGFKVAVWVAELDRHAARLEQLKPRLLVGQLAGAGGTLASLGDKAAAVRRTMMDRLGLGVPTVAWHSSRDSFGELAAWLGLAGSTLEKIAHEIELLAKNEVAELAESHEPAKGASSTMPQKRNPATCEAIIALGRILRGQVPLVMEATTQEHERDWWALHIEWKTLSEMCILCSGGLSLARGVIRGLHVDEERMRRNLELTRGLIASEAVMMRLARAVGRAAAHEILYEASMKAFEQDMPLRDVLEQTAAVRAALTTEELDRLLDPVNYLGESQASVDRILEKS
jgi:3-carboxy-cis,cis-muconate cycloisomerase